MPGVARQHGLKAWHHRGKRLAECQRVDYDRTHAKARRRVVQDRAEFPDHVGAGEAAEAVATKLAGRTITIAMRAGEEGKLFGSVTASDVVEAVAAQAELEVDRHDLVIAEAIKELGTHEVVFKPHPAVQIPVIVEVVAA